MLYSPYKRLRRIYDPLILHNHIDVIWMCKSSNFSWNEDLMKFDSLTLMIVLLLYHLEYWSHTSTNHSDCVSLAYWVDWVLVDDIVEVNELIWTVFAVEFSVLCCCVQFYSYFLSFTTGYTIRSRNLMKILGDSLFVNISANCCPDSIHDSMICFRSINSRM